MLKQVILWGWVAGWALGLGLSTPVVAQSQPPTAPVPSQAPQASPSRLQVQDLPSGYREFPPEMQADLLRPIGLFTQRLSPANLNPENIFAFIHPESAEMVLGFTSNFPNSTLQTQFDASLNQLQQPEAQKRMLSQLQEQLKAFQGLTIREVRPRPEFGPVANASAGMTVVMDMQGVPMMMDVVNFRRDNRLAVIGVMYTQRQPPLAQVTTIAQTLDQKIQQNQPVSLHLKGLSNQRQNPTDRH